jgi:hypothetical protein
LNYCSKNGEKELDELWGVLWKFLPSNLNVFEFLSIIKKNRSQTLEKKSIFIEENDNYLSVDRLSFILNKFALNTN